MTTLSPIRAFLSMMAFWMLQLRPIPTEWHGGLSPFLGKGEESGAGSSPHDNCQHAVSWKGQGNLAHEVSSLRQLAHIVTNQKLPLNACTPATLTMYRRQNTVCGARTNYPAPADTNQKKDGTVRG